jgi:hypothetical protein
MFVLNWFGRCEFVNLQCSNDFNGLSNSFVDLLNRSKVDIDSSPHDSFGDGEDAEEGDEENDLQEIEEDAFKSLNHQGIRER